ncbi:MAG: apolipoprotein N-acyltransferase, partial [Verrucomicrobiae bacterium]|nr:apolipoprotein N-acyltransferase [Verrucomicrobiae bacterium]NNJ86983.1 apolipoprotein N-acyltransferase [Akkermansiaceae bacterium]
MKQLAKFLGPVATAVISGGLLALCYPDYNLTGFVWVWMLPLLPMLWRGNKKRYGFSVGYLTGLVFWLINLKWIWTVSGLGAMAIAAFLALYFGIWGAIAVSIGNPWRRTVKKEPDQSDQQLSSIQKKIKDRQQVKKHGLLGGALGDSGMSLKFALINAAAWVALEWMRGWLFTGFGWNGLGVTFHNTPVLAQAADLVGVTGLSFLPVFMSAVIVQTASRLKSEAATGKLKPRLDFSIAALLLALQFCYGVWRIKQVNGWETDRVRVLLVQGNIPQTVKWDPRSVNDILQTYADTTQQAIEALESDNLKLLQANVDGESVELKRPDLVVWPESALPTPLYFADNFDGYILFGETRHLINEEIRPLGNFTLISGMNEFESDFDGERATYKEGGEQYNSIATVAPEGELEHSINTYRKIHLVIFGEYIPLVDQLPVLAELFKFSAGADFSGNFDAGTSTEPLVVPVRDSQVQLIPTVCFEDTVGRLTRQFVRNQPQMIINVTNDGWFKKSEAAAQHMANAKFRSIELRRPMIRAANTGVSGIISSTGSAVDPVNGNRQVIEDESGSHFVKSSLYGYAYAPTRGP